MKRGRLCIIVTSQSGRRKHIAALEEKEALEAYRKAARTLLERVPGPLPSVSLPLQRTLRRVLAADIHADVDFPPFDKSVVDGFAVRTEDLVELPARLVVRGQIAAGDAPGAKCRVGEAFHIMTGAPVPEGADTVEMIERTRRLADGRVELKEPIVSGKNIMRRASEWPAGAVALAAGRRIGPAEIGVLASCGRVSKVPVYDTPSVGILATGDELISARLKPRGGQIRDSNLEMLTACCRSLGIAKVTARRVRDTIPDLVDAVRGASDTNLLLIAGGLSMGERDYVATVLRQENAQILFHGLPIRPGKPVLAARRAEQLILGLPGNPVSALVMFHLFARPAIRKMMGFSRLTYPEARARLTSGIPPAHGRTYFHPAVTCLDGGALYATPIATKGSADLIGFSLADSLIVVPVDSGALEPDAAVTVMLLREGDEIA